MKILGKFSGARKRSSSGQKSGSLKVHRNLTEKWVARKDATERRRAERKAGLPKDRLKRFLYHFQPKRMYRYWFSRDGGIMALKIVGVGFVVGFVVLLGVFAYFRKDLPDLTLTGNLGGSIRYYDRTGKVLLWQDYDAVKRVPVKTDETSKYVRDATVAVEDKDFFKHGGFDVRGILRAGINDTIKHGSTQGGSTITQQLVKLNEDWSANRTITRKIKEVILAVELEREYSKQDILTGYLNTAPYGNVEYGVEAAARDYFHKSAKDLTLDESAFLAAIPKSPSYYSPYGPYFDKALLLGRQQYILDLMVNQGMITKDQAAAAKKVDILKKVHRPEPKYAGIKAPYFVLAAKDQLEEEFTATTVKRGGWNVTTTLDLKLQDLAEKSVNNDLANIRAFGGDTAAFAAEDVKTGEMVALVGGVDFSNEDHGKINYAHSAFIAPGSSFKPYDYSSLIETSTNAGAGSVLYDRTGKLPGYPCTHGTDCLHDYDHRSPGPITLRYALGGSRNIPAVKANLIVGTDKVIDIATNMMDNVNDIKNNRKSYNCYSDVKLTQTTQCYGASAIGDGAFLHLDDHVNGLATLARLGTAIPRTYILKITNVAGKDVQEPKDESYSPKQVLRPDTAYILDDMASDPNASYFAYGTKFQHYNGWHFAVKTGTTNDNYDGLMTSWSTKYAAATWVGYHTRNHALTTAMENLTMPITRTWMQTAHDMLHTTPVNWQKPSDIKVLPAYVIRSHVGYGSVEPSPSRDLYPSWYEPNKNQANANKPIDIISNKLATDCTPSLARKSASNSNSNIFSIDIFVDAARPGTNTSATDDVHKCDDERPSVSISSPGDGSDCDSPCSITATVTQGTHALYDPKYSNISNSGVVKLLINGAVVQTKKVSTSVSFSYSGTGNKTVAVQVIDSVLYDATSTNISVNFGNGPVSGVSAKKTDTNTVTITWSGGSGPFTVSDSAPPFHSKTCPDSSSCTMTLTNAPPGSTITVTDDKGSHSSATVTT